MGNSKWSRRAISVLAGVFVGREIKLGVPVSTTPPFKVKDNLEILYTDVVGLHIAYEVLESYASDML